MRALLAAGLLLTSLSAYAIPARIASGKILTPSFREIHEQYLRIVVHESGWRSKADQNGILQSLIHGARDGSGFDRSKMMIRMITHSGRTFPRNSRFLSMLVPSRLAVIKKTRTYHNEWVSGVRLECEEPVGWDETRAQTPWKRYRQRCLDLVDSTEAFLRGEVSNHCDGNPTTWGSERDAHRDGGPIDDGWKEILCDWPTDVIEVNGVVLDGGCVELREMAREDRDAKRVLLNSDACARNRFFDWRKTGSKR